MIKNEKGKPSGTSLVRYNEKNTYNIRRIKNIILKNKNDE